MHSDLAPEILIAAYAAGIFPMADEKGVLFWLAPDPRAVIELDGLAVSRSLRAVVRRKVFDVTVNRAFERVVEACSRRDEGTWISDDIKEAYVKLHQLGFAHSVESWKDGELAGGLYGVAIAGAFFGESMFHRQPEASKVALVHLVDRLRDRGFSLLDVQFTTDHLSRLGAIEIPKEEYERRLKRALGARATFVGEQDGPSQCGDQDESDALA